MLTPSHERFAPVTPAQPVGPRAPGALPVVTFTVLGLCRVMTPDGEILARSTLSRSTVPGACECTVPMTPQGLRTNLQLAATISSPSLRPPFGAGEGATTQVMMVPVGVP